jgi:restriction endonuclease S subunit
MKYILKTKLKDIASVQTGVFLKPQNDGEILYMQVKHFDNNFALLPGLHTDLKEQSVNQKHLLNTGDILFAAKGSNNFAVVYQKNYPKAVASTSFFVIKLTDENILPDYLAWFINYPKTMELLKNFAIGTSITSISKTVLEELEISVPEMQVQQSILKINELRMKQKTLVSKIEDLREQLIQQQIFKALK